MALKNFFSGVPALECDENAQYSRDAITGLDGVKSSLTKER